MSTDEKTTRLCVQIIEAHFGSVPARVASELLSRGRLRIPQIIQSTHIKSKLVATAILILVQHNLLWHSESPSEGEVYEVNWEEILSRLRYGEYLGVVERVLGPEAKDIVLHVMDHGKVRCADILAHFTDHPDLNPKSKTRIKQSLVSLLKSHYLKPTTPVLQISPRDRLITYVKEAEARKYAEPGAVKGPLAAKVVLEVKESAKKRMKSEEEEIEMGGFKKSTRKEKETMTSKSSTKRSKVEEDQLDETAFLRINPSKFDVHIRANLIYASAQQRYNSSCGAVLRAALDACIPNELSVSSGEGSGIRSDGLTTQRISEFLPRKTKLVGIKGPGFSSSSSSSSSSSKSKKRKRKRDDSDDDSDQDASHSDSDNDDKKKKSKKKETEGALAKADGEQQSRMLKEYIHILCGADNPTSTGRANAYLTSASATGGSSSRVTVEYETIGKKLRATLLEDHVRSRWGPGAVKIVRILLDVGKANEETIARKAMMGKREVQPLLVRLSEDSLIQLQDVPRGADRSAMRTIFLWYIDLSKTYSVLLTSLYKTLGNILERRAHEGTLVKPLLDKRARSDVAANIELLGRGEREALAEFDRKMEALAVLTTRVNAAIFVLKDMGRVGWPDEVEVR